MLGSLETLLVSVALIKLLPAEATHVSLSSAVCSRLQPSDIALCGSVSKSVIVSASHIQCPMLLVENHP